MKTVKKALSLFLSAILSIGVLSSGTVPAYGTENDEWTYIEDRGFWYVNMPVTGEKKLTLSDNEDIVYRVFDDGGEYGVYSCGCDGYIELSAPEGCVILLTGKMVTDMYAYDMISVYDGDRNSSALISDRHNYRNNQWEDISTVSTRNRMTIRFRTNEMTVFQGLDLYVKAIKDEPHKIDVDPVTGGQIVSSVTYAKRGEVVTLTAKPSSGYQLIDFNIRDSAGNYVPVTDMRWYTGKKTATFTMPSTPVRVVPEFNNNLTAPGGLFINFPANGECLKVTVPVGVTSFKVYDDGGKDNNYSNNYSGSIEFTAPEGCQFRVEGSVGTSIYSHFLRIYDGIGEEKIQKGEYILWDIDKSKVSLNTEGENMTLEFHSDYQNGNYWGIDLTVTVVAPNAEYPVHVEPSDRGIVTLSHELAKMNETVSMTVTPFDGYILTGISVKDVNNEDILINDIRWFTGQNTASFVMPVSAVTIEPTFELKSSGASLCIPSNGTLSVDLPEGMTSLKVYDDGGPSRDYSNWCNGKLVLNAPEGCRLSLSGGVLAGDDTDEDYLNVYDSDDETILLEKVKTVDNQFQNDISTQSSSNRMTLLFVSDFYETTMGLNLKVNVISPYDPHDIKVNACEGGRIKVTPGSAKKLETVTLTPEPENGYVLSDLSVTGESGRVSDLTDVLWYTDRKKAVFTMPDSEVTVTPVFCPVEDRFIAIPEKNSKTVVVPKSASSFKVYDNGGKNSNYSNDSNGTLCLMAPTGYRFRVSGKYAAGDSGDWLKIYDGSSDSAESLISINSSKDDIAVEGSAQSMTFSFTSDATGNGSGIGLDVIMVPVTYTVGFHANGGSGTMEDQSFTYDESKALRTNTFTCTDRYFEGWAKSDNGLVEFVDGEIVRNLSDEHGKTIDLFARWTTIKQGETPNTVFEATGYDSGILSGLISGKKYVVKGAATTTFTATGSSKVLERVSPGFLTVVIKGDGDTVGDSAAQNISITRSDTPSVQKEDCTVVRNDNGKLKNVSKDMEYRKSDSSLWIPCSGSEVKNLTPGTYYVRFRASGTVLSSWYQTLNIASYSSEDQVATPSFSPEGGIYTESLNVSIDCETENAVIYYTMDGSDPTEKSRKYNGTVAVTESTTLKAIALRGDMNDSRIAAVSYKIVDPSTIHNVTVKNGSGTGNYIEGTTVTIIAPDPSQGQRFNGWKTEDRVTFSDEYNPVTTFTMPKKDVVITAEYVTMTEWESMCGKTAWYEFDPTTGVLTISGSGEMDDYSSTSSYDLWNRYADKIRSVVVGGQVTYVEEEALFHCPILEEISVSSGNKIYASEDGVLYNKDKGLLVFCPPAKTGTITVPSWVEAFYPHSFYGFDGSKMLYTSLNSIGFSSGRKSGDSISIVNADAFGKEYSGSCVLTAPEGMRIDKKKVLPVTDILYANFLEFSKVTEETLLQDLLYEGGTVTLDRDYDLDIIQIPVDAVLDLNHHTLKADLIAFKGDLTVKNGTISGCFYSYDLYADQEGDYTKYVDEYSKYTLTFDNVRVTAVGVDGSKRLSNVGLKIMGNLVLKNSSMTIDLVNWYIKDIGTALNMDPDSELRMIHRETTTDYPGDDEIHTLLMCTYLIASDKLGKDGISRIWNDNYGSFLPSGCAFDCEIINASPLGDNDLAEYYCFVAVKDKDGKYPETVSLKASADPENNSGSEEGERDNKEEKTLDKVPFTEEGQVYFSPEDNFAPVAPGASGGIGGSIKKLELDFSKVISSGVDPLGLKTTVISGSKLTAKEKLKDKKSFKADKGIKVKVNKKTLIPTITCKKSGSVTLTFEDDKTYTVYFTVEKPKAQKKQKKMAKGGEPVKKTITDLFNTHICAGELKLLKQKHPEAPQAQISANELYVDPKEKDKLKLRYVILNKKYNITINVK